MSNRSKKTGLLIAGAVVVAGVAITAWSGMSAAEPYGGSGSSSITVGVGEESPDELQSSGSVTRSSPQSTSGGSRLQGAGERVPGEDGASAATDDVKKKSRKKKKGRRSRKSATQDEEEEAQKTTQRKRPVPQI